jgi:hypothetical protein
MTSRKLLSPSSFTGTASLLLVLLIVAPILFAGPSAMAQQTAAPTTTTTTTAPPLTPEEQQQQTLLQSTIAATTRNLAQGHKQIDGVVYTPRWSTPVWVKPNSLSILFVYCLPGEFADSGQEILGGSEMYVRQSFSLAVTNDITGWLMVVENDNQTNRLPAAVGVICTSDANEVQTRVPSPQQQTVINNIIQQFITIQNTQITNINQVINIINNVTTNQTGGVTPPPPANNTGGNNTGGVSKQPLTVEIIPNATRGFVLNSFKLQANIRNGVGPYSYNWGPSQEILASHPCYIFEPFAPPDYSCIVYTPDQAGTHEISVTVTDSKGKTGSGSIQITVRQPIPPGGGGAVPEPGGVAAPLEEPGGPASNSTATGGEGGGGTPPPSEGGIVPPPPAGAAPSSEEGGTPANKTGG